MPWPVVSLLLVVDLVATLQDLETIMNFRYHNRVNSSSNKILNRIIKCARSISLKAHQISLNHDRSVTTCTHKKVNMQIRVVRVDHQELEIL